MMRCGALLTAPSSAPAPSLHQLLPCSAQPSEALSSLAVDALWGTGLAWAQAKALELFDQAMRCVREGGWVGGGGRKAASAPGCQAAVPWRRGSLVTVPVCPSSAGLPCHPNNPASTVQPYCPRRPPCSAGWLLPAEATSARGLLKLDLRAQHAGTAELRMHRWLLDLRRSIGNTSTPCVLDTTKRICVVSHGGGVAGDSAGGAGAGGTGAAPGGSSEAAAAAALAVRLKGELGASLVQHQAPFRVAQEDGRAQRLESSTFMVKKWLFSGGCAWGMCWEGWGCGVCSIGSRLALVAQLGGPSTNGCHLRTHP